MRADEEAVRRHVLRTVVGVAVVGSAVLCWRGTSEPFTSAKFTIVLLCALAAVAVGVFAALRRGAVVVPTGPVPIALGAFLLLGAVAVVTSPSTGVSLFGQSGRASGYLLYLCCAVLLLAAASSFSRDGVSTLLHLTAIGGALVAAYALLQRTGSDPITWGRVYGDRAAFSTLGNTNFASGYLAIVLPTSVWMLMGGSVRRRVVGAAMTTLIVLAIVATGSAQGGVAALAGIAVLAAAVVAGFDARRRRTVGMVLAAAGLVGIVLGLAGLFGEGPLRGLNDDGFAYRRHYWRASWEMLLDHPVTGVGFDMWGGYFRESRTAVAAAGSGFRVVTDEPHSVPLAMFAGGGFPLGLAYLAFVAATGWTLVQGLRRSEGEGRLLVAAAGGAWVAYQVQSFVSIDVPALPVAHFVFAGVVLAVVGAVRWRRVPALPDRPARRRRELLPAWLAAVAGALVLIVGVWGGTRQVRAERHLQLAADAFADGSGEGLEHLGDATDLSPLPEAWIEASGYFAQGQRFAFALLAAENALEKDPRSFEATLDAARMATNLRNQERAKRHYERALELEPHAVPLRAEIASSYARVGLLEEALRLATATTRRAPDDTNAWKALGDVHRARGDHAAAARAYERSLQVDPENRAARHALELVRR